MPLDAFALLEAEMVCVNTRLKQGITESEGKGDINSHTLLTVGGHSSHKIQGPDPHNNLRVCPITYYIVCEAPQL